MHPSKPPTLEDVATHAGVSRGTASRALSGATGVAPRTREKVLSSAASLSYRVNVAARSLVTNRTGTIALVIGDTDERIFHEPFFAALAHGVGGRLAARGHLLALVASWPDLRTDFLRSGHVDGIVLASAHRPDPMVEVVLGADVPVVLVGGLPDAPHLPAVDVDNVGGARTATLHLVERGCRRVAIITGPPHMPVSVARRTGWHQALQQSPGVTGDEAVGDGMLGGLGGFFLPPLFAYLKVLTGISSTPFIVLLVLAVITLVWMHVVITRMKRTLPGQPDLLEVPPEVHDHPAGS